MVVHVMTVPFLVIYNMVIIRKQICVLSHGNDGNDPIAFFGNNTIWVSSESKF